MGNNTLLKQRVLDVALEKSYEVSKYDSAIFKLYQNYLYLKNKDKDFDIEKTKQDFLEYILQIPDTERLKKVSEPDSMYIWGMKPDRNKSERILNAINEDTELYFGEDAFLRCIVGSFHTLPEDKKKYQVSVGYIIDDLTAYFDGTRPSRMELILNSDFEVTDEQKQCARKIINKLIETKISKYNSQPIFKPKYGRDGVKKVLVIDQSYKDYSIIKGCADENTFKLMLDSAIKENPNADILVKTHPDAIGETSVKQKCYYQYLNERENIYKVTEPINPISMIEYVDKVYVCSSQFGFEALMCGKEVHTFGMPFYAGWGLTTDNQKCERRIRTRSLEELFYVAYILLPLYINPKTNKSCEIEEAIDYLIEMRNTYFKENNIRCEL